MLRVLAGHFPAIFAKTAATTEVGHVGPLGNSTPVAGTKLEDDGSTIFTIMPAQVLAEMAASLATMTIAPTEVDDVLAAMKPDYDAKVKMMKRK